MQLSVRRWQFRCSIAGWRDAAWVVLTGTTTCERHRHAALCRRTRGDAAVLISIAYSCCMLTGALLADDDAVRETAEAVRIAEERGDDGPRTCARCSRAGS